MYLGAGPGTHQADYTICAGSLSIVSEYFGVEKLHSHQQGAREAGPNEALASSVGAFQRPPASMVVGPLMDALAARKSGTSAIQILSKNNRLLISGLSFRTRALFWLTNLPYWALAARLATLPSPLAGPPWSSLHALAALLVAAASSAFHGCVLFGGGSASYERVTARLLVLDIIAANSYGVAFACYAGLADAVVVFAVPLALLTWSAVAKRSGQPVAYAVGHGAWHLLSAAALWRLHYSSRTV